MKKNDLILISIVVTAAALFALLQFIGPVDSSVYIQITVDGDIYGEYSFEKNQEIQINDTNVLEIKDRKAVMINADCPDQLCVHQRAIFRNGESIICLPNKVIATVVGGEEKEVDSVTN